MNGAGRGRSVSISAVRAEVIDIDEHRHHYSKAVGGSD